MRNDLIDVELAFDAIENLASEYSSHPQAGAIRDWAVKGRATLIAALSAQGETARSDRRLTPEQKDDIKVLLRPFLQVSPSRPTFAEWDAACGRLYGDVADA